MLGISSKKIIDSVSSGKKISRSGNNAVLWFIGLAVCYQIVYSIMLMNHLVKKEAPQVLCGEGSDPNSQQCLEIRLFRTWKGMEAHGAPGNDTAEELERLAQEKLVEHNMNIVTLSPSMMTSGSPSSVQQPREALFKQVMQSSSLIIGQAMPIVSFGTAVKIDKIFNETMAVLNSHSSVTPFGQKLIDSQARLEARMARLPSVKKRRHQQWLSEFDKLYNDTLEAIHSRNHSHDYAKKVQAMMDDFDTRNANLPSERKRGQRKGRPSSTSSTTILSLLAKIGARQMSGQII
jgi:hypothetical protein